MINFRNCKETLRTPCVHLEIDDEFPSSQRTSLYVKRYSRRESRFKKRIFPPIGVGGGDLAKTRLDSPSNRMHSRTRAPAGRLRRSYARLRYRASNERTYLSTEEATKVYLNDGFTCRLTVTGRIEGWSSGDQFEMKGKTIEDEEGLSQRQKLSFTKAGTTNCFYIVWFSFEFREISITMLLFASNATDKQELRTETDRIRALCCRWNCESFEIFRTTCIVSTLFVETLCLSIYMYINN